MFIGIAVHFLLKPFAAAWLGSGASATGYLGSRYAMFSQAFTGVALIGAGLVLLMNVLQSVVSKNRDAAFTDPLTGLPNRRALHQHFEAVKAGRRGDRPIGLAMIDIDRFKAVNDRFGHPAGDHVIDTTARLLKAAPPAGSLLARVGGEEFVALSPYKDEAALAADCDAMRSAIQMHDYGLGCPITVSIGWTPVSFGEDLNDAMRRADRGLYRAKVAGRNRCEREMLAGQADRPNSLRLISSGDDGAG